MHMQLVVIIDIIIHFFLSSKCFQSVTK